MIAWRAATISLRGMTRDVREVGIMQRLHRDDLSGWMIAHTATASTTLSSHALREFCDAQTDLPWLDRSPRDPGRAAVAPAISEESVADKERQLGPHAEGQLQQRPPTRSPASMFHATYFDDNTIWFDEFPPENELRCKVVACDPKGSARRQTETKAASVIFGSRSRRPASVGHALRRRDSRPHRPHRSSQPHFFRRTRVPEDCPLVAIGVEANFGQFLISSELERNAARPAAHRRSPDPSHGEQVRAHRQATLNYQLANFRLRFKRNSIGQPCWSSSSKNSPTAASTTAPTPSRWPSRSFVILVAANYEETT